MGEIIEGLKESPAKTCESTPESVTSSQKMLSHTPNSVNGGKVFWGRRNRGNVHVHVHVALPET